MIRRARAGAREAAHSPRVGGKAVPEVTAADLEGGVDVREISRFSHGRRGWVYVLADDGAHVIAFTVAVTRDGAHVERILGCTTFPTWRVGALVEAVGKVEKAAA